jgi:multidrug efflux pump subunit AcrA (membrane-fusion protein)
LLAATTAKLPTNPGTPPWNLLERLSVPVPPTRRRWLIAGGLVVLLAVGGTVWAVTRPATSTAATTTTSLVAAATTTLRQTIATTGTVAYATTSDQSFTVGGTVASVPVAVGQKVHAGQVLATADSAALAGALAQANSTLAAAQAKVASDTAASSTQLAADEASVSAAQAAVAAAQADLSKATLTSPIDGTVSALTLTPGQQLGSSGAAAGGAGTASGSGSGGASPGASGGSSGGGTSSSSSSSAQVEVVSTGHYVLDATVDDTEVGQLKAGETAGITLADGSVTSGTVTSVGMVASSTSGVASFPVVVTVAGTPSGLYPGSVLPVVMVTKTVPDALTVPVAALHRTASGTTVTVDRNGTRAARTVSTGLVSGGRVQITDGLTAGEKVVVTSVRVTAPAGTSGTTRTGGRTGFGGGFGGGGFGGGGGGGGGGGFRGGAGGGGN